MSFVLEYFIALLLYSLSWTEPRAGRWGAVGAREGDGGGAGAVSGSGGAGLSLLLFCSWALVCTDFLDG
jgi:hypothetical protein